MTSPLSLEALTQALADEETWLADSPERCAACGHRDCFHRHDYGDDTFEVCLVGECTCDGYSLVAPPVPGTYGETVLATGETKAISIVDLFGGAVPDRVPGVYAETLLAHQPLTLTRETVLNLTPRAAKPPPTMVPPIDVAVEKEGKR